MKNNHFTPILLLFLILECGCMGAPYSHRCTHFKPWKSNLVGVWKSDHGDTIELRKDGTASGNGYYLFNDYYVFDKSDINFPPKGGAVGRWYFDKHQDEWWILRIEWKSKGDFQGIDDMYMVLDFPPHTLLRDLDDPDVGNVSLFTRQNETILHVYPLLKLLIFIGFVTLCIRMYKKYFPKDRYANVKGDW